MVQPWKNCNFCKKPIAFGSTYWKCSVSTCNRKGTSYAFCSVQCWDGHVPVYNHRNAWAVEEHAPKGSDSVPSNTEPKPVKTLQSQPRPKETPKNSTETEVLVVASKLKAYIRNQSGFSTSASALTAISRHIRRFCDEAIEQAKQGERNTVMGRDFRGDED